MLQPYRCVITYDSLLLFSFVCSILSKIHLYCPANRAEFASLGRNSKVCDDCGLWLLSKKAQPSKGRLSRFAICCALLAFQHRERRANCNLPR